ncbi:MAG: Tat pathway signal protein [Paracoccaceae bacterium]
MANLNRRGFLIAAASASVVKGMPRIASAPSGRRILTLVYDKSIGAMRAIDRVVR